jgi:tryptophanase
MQCGAFRGGGLNARPHDCFYVYSERRRVQISVEGYSLGCGMEGSVFEAFTYAGGLTWEGYFRYCRGSRGEPCSGKKGRKSALQ